MEEFLVGFLIEVVGQLFAELGLRSAVSKFGPKNQIGSFISFLGYIALAVVIGGISLNFFPHHYIKSENLRILNLIGTPTLIGISMWFLRKRLEENQKNTTRLDSFIFGFSFAFVITLMRFFYAR